MLTVKSIFEKLEYSENISPSEAHNLYLKALNESKLGYPKVYLSNALSSGGFRRNKDLEYWDAFGKNADLSDRIRLALYNAELLNKDEFIFFPADTKSSEKWGQFEYGLFFVLIILGLETEEVATKIEEYVKTHIDMKGFSHSLSRSERIHSYNQLRDLVLKYIKDNKVKINPPQSLIQLLDNEESLGSTLEAEVAKALGAKILRVQIDSNSTDNSLKEIIEAVNYIKGMDSTFDFFGNGVSLNNKPIYLIEI